jgi:hypothetical protein
VPPSQRPDAAHPQPNTGSPEVPAQMMSWLDGVVRELDVRMQHQLDECDKKVLTMLEQLHDRVIANEPAHPVNCFCVPCVSKRSAGKK